MAGNTERKLLERSTKGDRILLGFDKYNWQPAIEHIDKMARGGAPGLKLLFAKRLDETSKIVRDYLTTEVKSMPGLHGEGSFILLRCTAGKAKPAELLGPAFELGENLPGEGLRIFYYSDGIKQRQWFEVIETRMRLKAEAEIGIPAGTFYPDCMKVLHAIEWLSQPVETALNTHVKVMKGHVRNEVRAEAYYASERNRAAGQESNWRTGQMRQAARIAMYLSLRRESPNMRMSGRIGTDDLDTWMTNEGNYTDLTAACVLDALRTDTSIHLKPVIVPYGSHVNSLLARNR